MNVGVIGGTGRLGYGLAVRAAGAGFDVAIGSRSREKAESVARDAKDKYGVELKGLTNAEAARLSDLLIVSVPYEGRDSVLKEISREVRADGERCPTILDVCVPFREVTSGSGALILSAAEETQALFGDRARVVSGLHTISAHLLFPPDRSVPADALVCGDSSEAKSLVIEVCQKMGIRAFDVGKLSRSRITEGLTPILIKLNKQYKTRDIGIRFTV